MGKMVYLHYYSKIEFNLFNKRKSSFTFSKNFMGITRNFYKSFEKPLKFSKYEKIKSYILKSIYKNNVKKKKIQNFIFKTCQIRFQQIFLSSYNTKELNFFESCLINFILKNKYRNSSQITVKN